MDKPTQAGDRPKGRVTSHDVARLAGVSRTTVSMVLNKSTSVALKAETRARVERAAVELGYQPNSAARMLVQGRTETVGLILSHPGILPVDGFIPQFLDGMARVSREHGYHFLVEGLQPGGGSFGSLVVSRRIDGLIVLNPPEDDPELRALIERGFPVVLAGTIGHPGETSISFSTEPAVNEAVDALVALGHRRFGSVMFSPPGFVGANQRVAKLRRALARHGLTIDEDALERGRFSAESGAVAASALLARRPDLTALFAGNDTIAVGVIHAARVLGRRVPDDLSVVGFDDLPLSAYLSPPLSTIRVDAIGQGVQAARMLVDLLKGVAPPELRVRMEAEFVMRGSCGPAPRVARKASASLSP